MTDNNRRDILKLIGLTCAAGATMSFSNLAMAATEAFNTKAALYLKKNEFVLLNDLVDVILPKTSTPSASELKVDKFIDYLVKTWMNTEEQQSFKQDLLEIAAIAKNKYQKNYYRLSDLQKTELLSELEMQAMRQEQQKQRASNPFEKSKTKQAFIKTLKQLTLIGYFTSSEGVAATLKHDPIPGSYQGCLDRKADDRGSYAGTLGDFGNLIEVKL